MAANKDQGETGFAKPAVQDPVGQLPLVQPDNVQGDSLAGFRKPYESFLFFAIEDVESCRAGLRDLLPLISTLEQIWYFNRAYAAARKRSGVLRPPSLKAVWTNVALTWPGLRKLWPAAPDVPDNAFIQGMTLRGRLLGDDHEACPPVGWKFGGSDSFPDVVLLVGADEPLDVARGVDFVKKHLAAQRLLWEEEGENPERKFVGTFGFRDGLSQPRVRCLLDIPGQPELYETPPEQNSVAVHEYHDSASLDQFLLGYGNSAAEHLYRDCTLAVFRRYVVLESAFEKTVAELSAALQEQYALAPVCDQAYLASRLMGRWPNGAFVGTNLERRYVEWLSHADTVVPEFDADQLKSCPFSSHIRKANPRNDIPEGERRRIIRRGMPFHRTLADASEETGLMFVCYQSSIASQFEHIQRHWMNNPNFPENSAGFDPVVGQNAIGIARERSVAISFPLLNGGFKRVEVRLEADFVKLDGGCYAIVPSMSLLRRICGPDMEHEVPASPNLMTLDY